MDTTLSLITSYLSVKISCFQDLWVVAPFWDLMVSSVKRHFEFIYNIPLFPSNLIEPLFIYFIAVLLLYLIVGVRDRKSVV